jgi:hypothetical protein
LFVRRHLLGLRGPSFAAAYRVAFVLGAVGFALALVGVLFRPPWQIAALSISALIGMYVIARVIATTTFERLQRSFEPEWLNAQSQVLRQHAFEVLRFTAQDLSGGRRHARLSYDLNRSDDVRALLIRRDRERLSRRSSKATVEFAYLTSEGALAVAEVHRDLPDLTFLVGHQRSRYAWVQFPQGRYIGRPGSAKRPAEAAYWTLPGPVIIAVGEVDYGDEVLVTESGAPVGTSGSGSAK